MRFKQNMISFKSRNPIIRNADRITRAVNTVYPHISESRTHLLIDKKIQEQSGNDKLCYKLADMKLKNGINIENLRERSGIGLDFYRSVIEMLKYHKLGNCYEESILAQLIGKINGLKNIYAMRVYFTRNSSRAEVKLRHAVAVLTDKPLEKGKKYNFRNNQAVILDPWLGITEFAGEYFNKLKTDFRRIFPFVEPNDITMDRLMLSSKNIKEFKKKKQGIFKSDFALGLIEDNLFSDSYVLQLKKEYPELKLINK